MTSVVDRFLKYVSFDTQSDETSETCPSTTKQKLLGEELVKEMMKKEGVTEALKRMDQMEWIRRVNLVRLGVEREVMKLLCNRTNRNSLFLFLI